MPPVTISVSDEALQRESRHPGREYVVAVDRATAGEGEPLVPPMPDHRLLVTAYLLRADEPQAVRFPGQDSIFLPAAPAAVTDDAGGDPLFVLPPGSELTLDLSTDARVTGWLAFEPVGYQLSE